MEDKTESLRKKLANIKNSSLSTDNESDDNKKNMESAWRVMSPFISSGVFWLCLEQLNAKFPEQFIHFGYWELFLYNVSLLFLVSIFKSK